MTSTPPEPWLIGGTDPIDRLMAQLERREWVSQEMRPTHNQVSMVLHGLADHTLILDLLGRFRPPRDPRDPWPEATAIGRGLHALGDLIDRRMTPPTGATPAVTAGQIRFAIHTAIDRHLSDLSIMTGAYDLTRVVMAAIDTLAKQTIELPAPPIPRTDQLTSDDVRRIFALPVSCPECAAGKCRNCPGQSIDPLTDQLTTCPCDRPDHQP